LAIVVRPKHKPFVQCDAIEWEENMHAKSETYAKLAAEIDALFDRRERVIASAFDEFEKHDDKLAVLLTMTVSNRRRAALWMCQPFKQLGGKNAYQALAEGDMDAVWDLLLAQSEREETLGH
jgi:hypothetical protein